MTSGLCGLLPGFFPLGSVSEKDRDFHLHHGFAQQIRGILLGFLQLFATVSGYIHIVNISGNVSFREQTATVSACGIQ